MCGQHSSVAERPQGEHYLESAIENVASMLGETRATPTTSISPNTIPLLTSHIKFPCSLPFKTKRSSSRTKRRYTRQSPTHHLDVTQHNVSQKHDKQFCTVAPTNHTPSQRPERSCGKTTAPRSLSLLWGYEKCIATTKKGKRASTPSVQSRGYPCREVKGTRGGDRNIRIEFVYSASKITHIHTSPTARNG